MKKKYIKKKTTCCFSSDSTPRKDSRVGVADRPSSRHLGQGEWHCCSPQLHRTFVPRCLLLPAHSGHFVVLNMRRPLGAVESLFPFQPRVFESVTRKCKVKREQRRWSRVQSKATAKDLLSVMNSHAKSPVYHAHIYIQMKYWWTFYTAFTRKFHHLPGKGQ